MDTDWQKGATHLKTHRANGPWRAEQTFVCWAHWACGIGCSHRACVATASGHASGLPWALKSPCSGKALPIPVTHLLKSSHSPLLKEGVTCVCKLLHWMELCCWPPVNTHTALYPAGRRCLSNLTGLSWCPSAQHHWVWTSPTLCKAVQDPDQQQPHQNRPHYIDHFCTYGRS